MHDISECAKKLIVLLDVIEKIDRWNEDTLPYTIDQTKQLARELKNESELINKLR